MMESFWVEVGYSSVRPIMVDQHSTLVNVITDAGLNDALLMAAQIVGGHAEMVTSTRLILVEI